MKHTLLHCLLATTVLIPGCASHEYRTLNPDCVQQGDEKLYRRDGHQDTVFIVAIMAGRPALEAASLSFYAQAPDDVSLRFEADSVSVWGSFGFWGYRHRINAILHSLHGGDRSETNFRRQRLGDLFQSLDKSDPDYAWKSGFLLHAYGDSFAHTNAEGASYGELYGHLFDGHAPDIVGNRPELYIDYVTSLYTLLDEGAGRSEERDEYLTGIRALQGQPNSAYIRLIRETRAAIPTTIRLDCKNMVDQLSRREVDAFLREVEAHYSDGSS